MARLYAQFAAAVFLIVGAGGLLTGDASHVVNGHASGNFDGVALHLTYVRDALNILLFAAFFYAGVIAEPRRSRTVVLGAGALLLLLAVVGFVIDDDVAGSRSIAALHFPLAINVLDLVAGVFAVLTGLGSLREEPSSA